MDRLYEKARHLCGLLISAGKTLSTAESCTGGMIGQCITAIAGSSEVYGYGFVTYSNEAKQKLLGVKRETLDEYGAVSSQTVCEMAKGALGVSDADFAVAVSGIAGPGGGTPEKPVGLVYAALAEKDGECIWKKLMLDGDRDAVRKQTAEAVFDMLTEKFVK